MALWNPFNLFKKKEKPAPALEAPIAPEPPAIAEPPAEISTKTVQSVPLAAPAPGPSHSVPEPPRQVPPTPAAPADAAPITRAPATTPTQSSVPDQASKAAAPPESLASPVTVPATTAAAGPKAVPAAVTGAPTEVPAPSAPTAAAATAPAIRTVPVIPSAPKNAVTDAAESPPADARTQVPFVEQKAPTQPVDLAAKISRRPTTEKPAAKPVAEDSSGGLMGWFRSAIRKTAQVLNTDIRDLVGRDGRLVDEDFLQELFTHLIKTDMGVAAATEIRTSIQTQYRGRKVHLNELIHAAKTTIREIMKQEEVRLTLADQGTSVIMVVGVNGSGKTTSIAKLANMFRQDGKSVVLGAGDTFRAAAVEQLRQWAGRIGAEIVTGEDRSDPASVAYRAAKHAVDRQADICIVDTAGRLQTQSHLMQELAKIRRVIDKVVPGAPHETLLVLDSTAGQNAISQARGFSEAAGCTGIILAKLDGTAKGGVAIPIRKEFNLPVKFIGFGETADAIAPFDVERYVDALFNID
jgi:fused signal recognition particle receptor